MKTALIVSTLVTGVFFAHLAEADRADRRQGRQGARIEQGVRSGSLSQGEAARLKRGQARIERAEGKAMADGEMSRKEKAKLEGMQDHQSRAIYRLKHNDRAAPQAPEAGSNSGQ